MGMPSVYIAILVSSALLGLPGRGGADESSGCPSYGCLPSGTFSLSSDIPGTGNDVVGTKWTTLVSGTAVNQEQAPGCVSCQEGVVCATRSGYVAVDQQTGELIWRYDNMTSPSLPVLDIYGDVIGTDGKHLIKIEPSGKVDKPIIKIYNTLAPMYSIQVTNDNLILLTSHVSAELITYVTNGIPEASLVLRGTVERVTGSFTPVAQPVISGKRAYILTQFLPDPPHRLRKGLGLQRLYAVDLWARMTQRINPVWYVNFQRMTCGDGSPRSGRASPDSYILAHNGTVYVGLGKQVGCRHGSQSQDEPEDMLWALRDNGTEADVLFKVQTPISGLSIYDVSLGGQSLPPKDTAIKEPKHQSRGSGDEDVLKFSQEHPTSHAAAMPSRVWVATEQLIKGYNSLNGSLELVIDVGKFLNASCQITSKVMVTRSKDGRFERLVLGVVTTEANRRLRVKGQPGPGKPFVVAFSLTVGSTSADLLWKVAGEPGTKVVGQIANVLYVPPEKRDTPRRESLHGILGSGWVDRGVVDTKVVLVGTAVNDTAQFSFALGSL